MRQIHEHIGTMTELSCDLNTSAKESNPLILYYYKCEQLYLKKKCNHNSLHLKPIGRLLLTSTNLLLHDLQLNYQ